MFSQCFKTHLCVFDIEVRWLFFFRSTDNSEWAERFGRDQDMVQHVETPGLIKGGVTPSRAQRHFKTLLSACPCVYTFVVPLLFPLQMLILLFLCPCGLFRAQNRDTALSRKHFEDVLISVHYSPSYSAKPHPTRCRIKRPSYYCFFRSSSSLSRWWPTFVWSWEKPAGFMSDWSPSGVFGGGNTHTVIHTCSPFWLLDSKLSIINNYIMQFTQDIWAIMRVERTLKAGRSWIMKQAISLPHVKSVLMLWDCRENWKTRLPLNIARDTFNH